MTGIENIQQNDGFLISASGLSIVFISLILISVYIALLPRILGVVHRFLPENDHPDVLAAEAAKAKKPAAGQESMKQAAAAAVAYHQTVEGSR